MKRLLFALKTIFTALPTWLLAASIVITVLSPVAATALAGFLAASQLEIYTLWALRVSGWLSLAAYAVRNLSPAIRKGLLTLEQEQELREDEHEKP